MYKNVHVVAQPRQPKSLRTSIMGMLVTKKHTEVAVNPDKVNIKYEVVPFVSTNHTFGYCRSIKREFPIQFDEQSSSVNTWRIALNYIVSFEVLLALSWVHFGCCDDVESYVQGSGTRWKAIKSNNSSQKG